ncbi:hypothetical protein [Paenibacillus azoreducens]|uniref:Uncharacterized protein n=1 Tax=Paenibacillus azoreducens TaxID=116718 RepID=A0A920CNB0_9BACL|nr:hypothetical protein [Paenibacillus azoreducens]GIO47261.1 hypothetical protein J34TS1_20260 [Paenibacillus azoreducens]
MVKKDEQMADQASMASAYTKVQFLSSSRYTPAQRDILAAILEDEKTYTDSQAKQALETYLRKEVR